MSRFLVDENLSPALAASLTAAGHDARHVNDVGLRGTPDGTIMGWAARERRTVITADHDFHDHLFATGAASPSVVRVSQRGPAALAGTARQAERLASLLPGLEPYLASGIAVAVDGARLSVSPLPLSRRLHRLPTGTTRLPTGTARLPAGTDKSRGRADEVLARVRERRLQPPGQSLER